MFFPFLSNGARYFHRVAGNGGADVRSGLRVVDYALATLVEDIEALRHTLGVPKLALIGHSFGAVLALEYAATYPDHVSHLIVASGLWDTLLRCRLRLERLAELRPEAYARARGDTIAPDGTRRTDILSR